MKFLNTRESQHLSVQFELYVGSGFRQHRYQVSVPYVTGSPKTSHVHTKTKIHFIAQDYSYTQEVSMHSVSTAQCERVCFSEGDFANPVMSRLREWHL